MKSIVTVDGTDVFSAKWTMEQMTALMNLIDSNRRRTYICYALNKKSFLGGQRSRVPSGAPKTEFSNENSVFYVSEGTRTEMCDSWILTLFRESIKISNAA